MIKITEVITFVEVEITIKKIFTVGETWNGQYV